MLKFFCSLIFSFLGVAVCAQDVDVIWQHGLRGSEQSWETLASQFQLEREMVSNRPDVESDSGVVLMANAIIDSTDIDSILNDRTIGIGHSMGGVAFREILSNLAPDHIDALVTVGSPLNGARIADNLQNGNVTAYIRHGARQLMKGPRRQGIPGFIFVSSPYGPLTGQALHEILFNENRFGFLNFGLAKDNQSITDLSVDESFMMNARLDNPTVPKVSLYGTEERPVHYRTISSFTGGDGDVPRLIRRATSIYHFAYMWNRWRFWSPVARWRASGWKAGRDYLREGSESGWNALIDARRRETRQICREEINCDQMTYWRDCVFTDRPAANCANCITVNCRTVRLVIVEPSDGLINVSSQIGQSTAGVASGWSPNRTYELIGANHGEQRRHPATYQRLNSIFENEDNISTDFLAPER